MSQELTYPYLPDGRKILFVSAGNPFMKEAAFERNNHSTEANHPTGAVVVLKGQIVGRGANQAGVKNKKLQELHKKYLCFRRLFKIPSGQKYWLCPGCAKFSDHGEAQAVKDALRHSKNIHGADLYLYGHWWCCKPCWDRMIEAGIKDVYLLDESRQLFK
jgi:tRNA(Arg) A34 adenosine deaminase TadA